MAKIADWNSHIGRRLRLRGLHVFFTVVEMGSIAKAAAHLRVTQPAVSQLIAELEHAVGAKLFDRGPRGVAPTIYGRALLSRARNAFDELKQGIRDIEFLSDATAGELKIGCPEAIAVLLAPVVEDFRRRHPRVVLDVFDEEFDRHAAKLRERNLDLILQRLRHPPRSGDRFFDDFDVDILFEDRLVIAAAACSRWAKRRKIDLVELLDETWIMATPESFNNTVISEACGQRDLPMPSIGFRTFSTHLRANLVSTGNYIATFPQSVVQFYADRFGLKALPVELPPRPWPVVILTLKHRTLSPIVQVFIDHVRTSMTMFANAKESKLRP